MGAARRSLRFVADTLFLTGVDESGAVELVLGTSAFILLADAFFAGAPLILVAFGFAEDL